MIYTQELLKSVQKAIKNDTIYSLAKNLKVSRTAVKYWLNGHPISDSGALRGAELSDLNPDYALFSIAAERAKIKDDDKLFEFWKQKADSVSSKIALTICFILPFTNSPSPF